MRTVLLYIKRLKNDHRTCVVHHYELSASTIFVLSYVYRSFLFLSCFFLVSVFVFLLSFLVLFVSFVTSGFRRVQIVCDFIHLDAITSSTTQ